MSQQLTVSELQRALEEWGHPEIHVAFVNGKWKARVVIKAEPKSMTATIDGEQWTGLISGTLEGDGEGDPGPFGMLVALAAAWMSLKRDAVYRSRVGAVP